MTERELHEFAERAGRNFETPQAARELDDVDLRLKHMDELGIDVQVLHNTFWIERITTRPDAEVALCRSWNRWLADISKKSHGRLFYSCVVPAMNIDAAIEEMKFAKENGAAAVCMRPLEGERHLSDPYFYPLYQIASDLDLSIAVHIANGNPENADLYRLAPAGRFAQFRVPTVTACYDVIMSDLHERFPKLRWGFIEASAQWVPWIYREAAIRYRAGGRAFPKNVFEEYNIFVTCQVNDDVPYIVRCCGENRLSDRHRLRPHRSVKRSDGAKRISAHGRYRTRSQRKNPLAQRESALRAVGSSCLAVESTPPPRELSPQRRCRRWWRQMMPSPGRGEPLLDLRPEA